jgi:prephenate dehydratase
MNGIKLKTQTEIHTPIHIWLLIRKSEIDTEEKIVSSTNGAAQTWRFV